MSKLRAIRFTELYIDPDRPSEALLRGLDGTDEGVTQIEESYLSDLQAISGKIRLYHMENKENDFLIVHDDVRYRCSSISAGMNDPDASFYCLRRVATDDLNVLWKTTHPSIKRLASSLSDRRGMIIFSGTFSTGKTRNASACVDYWASNYKEVAVTLEDPPEYNLDRRKGDNGVVIQTNVVGGNLNQELINLRRWAPRYVFFGELRTPTMAAALLHMSLSGPLCLCTLHASSATQAIFSLVRFASEVMAEDSVLDIISSSLQGIAHHERYGSKFRTITHDLTDADAILLKTKIRNGRASSVEEELNRRILARG